MKSLVADRDRRRLCGPGNWPAPRGSRGPGEITARTGLAAAIAGIALVAAACGGGASTTAGQTAYQKGLNFAQCMRSHGLPGFPDPNSQGIFITTRENAGDFTGPRFQPANKACAHLEGPGMSAAQRQATIHRALKFAACMRAHGITNFPDPVVKNDKIGLGFTPASGINPNSPQFQSAQQRCQGLFHPFGGGGGS